MTAPHIIDPADLLGQALAESALITVAADCHLAGVSTRWMNKLVKRPGISSLSRSQVSRMAADLDEQVTAFRHRRRWAARVRSRPSPRTP